MKLKELIKIYKQLKGKSGCIVITKDRGGALAVRYGDFIKKHIGLGCIIHPNSSEAKELFNIFPELKESEDERIFEEIYKDLHTYYMVQRDKFVLTDIKEIWDDKWSKAKAWLEKQGENNIGILEATKQKLEDNLNKALEKETQESWSEFLDKQGEQKSAWSEEDEIALGDALWCCKQAASIAKDENDMGNAWYAENWLKSLKDRILPQQKQEWSEEDSNMLQSILDEYKSMAIEKRNWLKSLRPQHHWKPSELQIEALESATENCAYSEYQDCLRELMRQLKTLK